MVSVVVPLMPEELAVIVAVPPFLALAMPEDRTFATLGFEDFHDTPTRLLAVLPSLKVPLAVNFTCVPVFTRGLAGLIVIDTRCAVETVSSVDPFTEPNDAEIVVVPVALLEASPCAAMLATAGLEELHTTVDVMSCVEASLNVPVAENCFVVPTAMLGVAGVTLRDTNVAAETVSDALPLTEPEVAVIVAVPPPTPLTRPVELTVATEVAEELHVTCRSWVLPSSKLPVAVN